METIHRSCERRKVITLTDFRRHEEEVIGSLCRLSNRSLSPKAQMEQEKRIRREIANSNERRRMQSINAGFQALKSLLPHHEGEKLSKAAILQQTSEYIYQLEQEKTKLLSQNCQLRRLVNSQYGSNAAGGHDSDGGSSCTADSPVAKRKKLDTVESSDEGIGNMSPYEGENGIDDIKREMIELRIQLDRERRMRLLLEEQTRNMEAQLYPDQIREIAHQIQLQYKNNNIPPSADSDIITQGKENTSEHNLKHDENDSFVKLETTLRFEPPISSTLTATDSTSSCPESDEPQDLSTTQGNAVENCEQPQKAKVDLDTTTHNVMPPSAYSSSLILDSSIDRHQILRSKLLQKTVSDDDNADKPVNDSSTLKAILTTAKRVAESRAATEVNGDDDDLSKTLDQHRIVTSYNHHHSNVSSTATAINSTSRQNLETIVEAIRHLEGDHLFQDDKPNSQKSCVKMEKDGHLFRQQHPQVIQCSPISRPGVIVATHS